MMYVISKATFGSYNVRDIQFNVNWTSCPYSDYARIPDNLVDGILATQGYCDITLNSAGNEVASFTARTIPSVPEECHGTNTVLSVNGVEADTNGEVTLNPSHIGASATGHTHAAGDITNGKFSTSRLPTVPVNKGGTGATDEATARTNLGITPANIGALPTSKIIAVAKSLTFTDGVATYTNAGILSGAVSFAQFRAGTVATLADSVLATYPNTPSVGTVTIISKLGQSGALPVLILVINP